MSCIEGYGRAQILADVITRPLAFAQVRQCQIQKAHARQRWLAAIRRHRIAVDLQRLSRQAQPLELVLQGQRELGIEHPAQGRKIEQARPQQLKVVQTQILQRACAMLKYPTFNQAPPDPQGAQFFQVFTHLDRHKAQQGVTYQRVGQTPLEGYAQRG